jgi:transposase, IS30 family
MKTYSHLSEEERNLLVVLLNRGKRIRSIARVLGRQPSTITREIKRNNGNKRYRANLAQQRAVERHCTTHSIRRLKSHALRLEVGHMIVQGHTPEQIAGRLPLVHPELPHISHEAIYQWIYSEKPDLIGCLPRHHRQRWPKGKGKGRRRAKYCMPERIPVSQRPPEANDRSQPGHWETDLVIGSGRSALQVSVERTTRLCKLGRIPNQTAPAAHQGLVHSLADQPPSLRRSITYDNGSENYEHMLVNKELQTISFFCEPYHSWEKGTVENTNGIIRRRFPKRTNFDTLSLEEIQAVETWLNNRPRKCLKFATSIEAFAKTVALAP